MIKLDTDEKILLKVRKHWFILLSEAAFLIVILTTPFIAWWLLSIADFETSVNIGGDVALLSIFFISLWLLFVWMVFFTIWTDYYLDILIVTNKHVIDIEQKGLFRRELSQFRLDRVQDVTAEMDGIIQTVFNFGVIHIQTAGEGREFSMNGVPDPFEVRNFISDEHDKSVERLRTVNISPESLKQIRNS